MLALSIENIAEEWPVMMKAEEKRGCKNHAAEKCKQRQKLTSS
jgi:hypothetical protein